MPTPEWTRLSPQEPGFYWYKFQGKLFVARFTREHGELIDFEGSSVSHYDETVLWWSEPIQPHPSSSGDAERKGT